MTSDRGAGSELFAGVPRETLEKLRLFESELTRWQRVNNLVGPRTLPDIWSRHFADSLQLASLAPGRVWLDIGSGAGFPGLVIAICDPSRTVHLVESDSRRCAFLRHVARLTGASAKVWDRRIEHIHSLEPFPTVVTARAVAPLSTLLSWTARWFTPDTTGLFPKGRDYERELTEARLSWTFALDVIPSRVDAEGRVLRIRDLAAVSKATPGNAS